MNADHVRAIAESVGVALWEAELPQLCFSYVSPAVVPLAGYPRTAWYEPGFWQSIIHEAERDWVVALCQEQTRAGRDHEIAYRIHAADGTLRHIRDIVSVSVEPGGRTVLRGAFVDVTRAHREEVLRLEAAAESHAAAHRAGILIERLAAEMRGPLAELAASARGLAADPGRARAEAAAVERAAARLEELVAGARHAAGAAPPPAAESGRVDLAALVAEVRESLLPRARARAVDIEVDVEPEARIAIRGDRAGLERMVADLLADALRHASAGQVRLSVRREAGRIRLLVSDEGMPPDRPVATGAGETGKGSSRPCAAHAALQPGSPARTVALETVRALVEERGGSLRTVAHPGIGNRVEVTLPAATPDDEHAGQQRRAVRALYVEDDPTNAEVMTELLKLQGAETVVAAEGPEALARFRAEPFDIVLMDLRLPGMSGIETARRMRAAEAAEDRPRTPIVAVTAHSDRSEVRACIEAGMDAHMAKPLRMDTLAAVMARHVRERAAG
jgi:PAS domain S-box-containing protein